MNDGVFGLAHVIFHLVLAAVLHGSRSPQIFKTRREQNHIKSRKIAERSDQTSGPSQRRAGTIATIEKKGVL